MFPSFGLHEQLELISKYCHYAAKYLILTKYLDN